MKLNNETRFPYPVLSSETGDYKQGNFAISLIIEEVPTNGKLNMKFEVILEEAKLVSELKSNRAVMGLFITCLDTFFNRLIKLDDMTGNVTFPAGTLKGRTVIQPLIYASQTITAYSNDNLHDEYEKRSWDFQNGSILAIGDELVINVGHEKLAPMETIFTLAVIEDLQEGEINVTTHSENITIYTNQNTFECINNLRGTKNGRSILLNCIYLPVVMEVLSHLQDNESSFADKKWFKVFNAKCEHLGINYDQGNILIDAQRLLKMPISKLKSIGEVL